LRKVGHVSRSAQTYLPTEKFAGTSDTGTLQLRISLRHNFAVLTDCFKVFTLSAEALFACRLDVSEVAGVLRKFEFNEQTNAGGRTSRHTSKMSRSLGTALLVGRSQDRSPVLSLGILSEANEGTMYPGVDSASKNEYQENSWE
jgi:hypothetical protein